LHSGHDNSALATLTRREREVLALFEQRAVVDKEIAQAMGNQRLDGAWARQKDFWSSSTSAPAPKQSSGYLEK